jgi:hypothetical protein
MRPDSGAPRLPAALQPVDAGDGKKLPLEGPAAAYTARTLRSGYLYVYDERGTWDKYWITPQGYLMKVAIGDLMSAAYTVGREPCDKTGHKEIAACITVNDPDSAKRIWVDFSDAEWTARVLKLHQDEAYRQRHMRVFDMKAWMGTHKGPHAQALDTVASVVAEYAPKTRVERFAFSPYPFHSRASTKDSLLHAASTLGPQPAAVLILDDPVGIVSEIGTRLADANKTYMAQDLRVRKLSVSTAILALQSLAIDRAQLSEIQGAAELELLVDSQGAYVPDLPVADAADLRRVATITRKQYGKDYHENARHQWQDEFNKEYDQFYKQTLLPLAESHAAWMISARMLNYLDCTHDGESAEAGLLYTRVMTRCVQGTEQHGPCGDLYARWLTGTFSDGKNILLRGIVLNIDTNRKKLIESLKPDVPWRALGWDTMFATFNASIGHVKDQTPEVLGRFLHAISGSITRMLRQGGDASVSDGAVALGMVSGRPVMPVELSGRYEDFRAALIRQLMTASGATKLSGNAMKREVSLALRRLKILGEPMKTQVSSKFLALVDEKRISSIPAGLSNDQVPRWLAGAIVAPEAMEKLDLRTFAEMGKTAGEALPLVGNVMAVLFQVYACNKVSNDLADSMAEDKSENRWRLHGAMLALGATAADTLSHIFGALAESTLVAGRAVYLKMAKKALDIVGRGFGLLGAGINAIWDAKGAIDAATQDNYPLALVLALSSASGFILTSLLALDGILSISISIEWFFLTFSIFVGTGIATPFLQDDRIDKWLKHCYWGILDESERYRNLETEMTELSIATKGV